MEILQEIGSYAGLAAVFGLAVLSALYFSQARDVKRLREWAARAPLGWDPTDPEPVARACAMLLSTWSGAVTGAIVPADGGAHAVAAAVPAAAPGAVGAEAGVEVAAGNGDGPPPVDAVVSGPR